ncbi:MAG: helicase-related protein [Gemmatimonadaceae bacterium]
MHPARRTPRPAQLPAVVVKASIARTLLQAPNETDTRLGSIALQPHQLEGVARLRRILLRHRGALLADEVGLGKTYTALGVAQHFSRVEIVGPAALRAMWHEACARCEVAASYVSAESLSRALPSESAAELVLIDEAHWFRNPATKRYRRLARRCRNAMLLLLSATPVHNRPEDLESLFALFLGARASRLAPNDVAELTVRRRRQIADALWAVPSIQPTHWWRVRCDKRVVATLDAIAVPVPPRDGGVAVALLRLTLLRRLSSSQAALRATLRRMLARSLALLDAARGGRYPTARELCGWLLADEAIQLALPGFMVNDNSDPNESPSADAIEGYAASVRAALAALDASRDRDRRRAWILRQLMRRFPDARIVAFSQYDATVRALARELCSVPGVAVLSGKGGRIATGGISRATLLQQFDAAEREHPVHPAMRVRLLLTTDLLSEGVNLHDARVLVHLDIPWTPARLEQRVGRLSRLGSPHGDIHVFGFAPPHALDRVQRTVSRLRAKWSLARRRFGDSALLSHDALFEQRPGASASSYTVDQEALLELVKSWLGTDDSDTRAAVSTPVVACVGVDSPRLPLALALVRLQGGGGHRLVALEGRRAVTSHPHVVLQLAQHLTAAQDVRPSDAGLITRIIRRFERFLARARGAQAASADVRVSTASLHAHIAHAIARLPRSTRPRALRLAAGIRAALLRARSAGDQAVLDERCERLLARVAVSDPFGWLEDVHSELVACLDGCLSGPYEDPEGYWLIGILIGI